MHPVTKTDSTGDRLDLQRVGGRLEVRGSLEAIEMRPTTGVIRADNG